MFRKNEEISTNFETIRWPLLLFADFLLYVFPITHNYIAFNVGGCTRVRQDKAYEPSLNLGQDIATIFWWIVI